MRNVTLAMNEAIGAIGIICPDRGSVARLPLARHARHRRRQHRRRSPHQKNTPPSSADLYQVFDTSDLPGGVVNIVAGRPAELAKTLAEHDDIDAIWCFRDPADATIVKARHPSAT